MSAPVIDFLPAAVRRDAAARLSRRRTGLLAALMIVMSLLAGVHSWSRARAAQADLDLETRMFQQASNIDEMWDRLVAEHRSLKHGIEVTDGLLPPVQAANVVAAISRMLPDHVSICGLRIEREETPRRLQVIMKGFGGTGADVAKFQQQLAECPIFQSVVLSERRTSELAGRRGEEFSITMQVPLEVLIEAPASMLKVAMGGSR
ncbi:MAG: PilN domain-containing protein [Planctomycetota bacterium]